MIPGLRRLVRGRVAVLLVARVVEQLALGVASLLLAWRLGVHPYTPIATLLIVNSFAVTLSDFGLGTAVMGSKLGTVGQRSIWRVRGLNAAIVVVGLVVALALNGSASMVVGASVVLWFASAEAFVRKAALIRAGRVQRVAVAEILGALVFSACVAVALVVPSHALVWTAAGLLAKHVLESAISWGWRVVFGNHSGTARAGELWMAQVLHYLCSNVDFVVVGLLLGAAAFSVYSVAFRVASVVAAQVSFTVVRVMLVEFADASDKPSRQRTLDQRTKQLFAIGLLGAVLTAAAAPVLPLALGSSWKPVTGVVVILAFVVPWRMVMSVTLSLAMGSHIRRELVIWEIWRLLFTAVLLFVGAWLGFAGFVVAVGVATVVAAWAQQEVVVRSLGLSSQRWLHWATPVVLGVVVLAGSLIVISPK